MESLVCRTGPRCLPSSTGTSNKNEWRWRSTVSMACSRLSTSACTSQVWTSSIHSLNLSRPTLLSRELRCQAAFGHLEEAGATEDSAGLLVSAYQREEIFDIPEMFHNDIEEMGWDVIDVATIEKVLESNPFEAIVCTVGGGITRADFDKDVPIKLVNAAKMAGVKVSNIGARDSVKAVNEKILDEVAEEAVKSSNLNYTIIRPGGLVSASPTGNGILTEKSGIAWLISRADLAALILDVLFNEKFYGKTLTAIDQGKGKLTYMIADIGFKDVEYEFIWWSCYYLFCY